MTVALSSYCNTMSNSVKQISSVKQQLKRRRLPMRARLAVHRKKDLVAEVTRNVKIPSTSKMSRLGKLRRSYARRGITIPPQPPDELVVEVSKVSLAGAERRFVALDVPPSDCDSSYHSDSSSSIASFPSRVKFVQFASHCAVVEIPHFCEYSLEQKAAMWNGSKKIRSMARKNTAEYQYDGWNMESVAEEDQFVLVAGIPVHPAHVSAEYKKKLEAE